MFINKRTLSAAACGILLLAGQASATEAVNTAKRAQLIAEARQQSKKLALGLKQTLQQSLKSGGTVAAVQSCNLQAPEIAGQLSQGQWQVGRTAEKLRNSANAPDAWEQQVLADFRQQLQSGKPVQQLEAVRISDGQFRYMKAIPTGSLCLACHGEALSDELSDTIDRLYPQDQARGFQAGQLRGAFTLSKTLGNTRSEARSTDSAQ